MKSKRIFIPRLTKRGWEPWPTYEPTTEQLDKWKHPNLDYGHPFDTKDKCAVYCIVLNSKEE